MLADICQTLLLLDWADTEIVCQVNKEGLCQQRSLKYFQGLAQGCWLVAWPWLEACAAAGKWLDEAPFEVAGDHFAQRAPHTGKSLSVCMSAACADSSFMWW